MKFVVRRGDLLFGFPDYRSVYELILAFKEYFAIPLHITPHSLRAGGATYFKMQGMRVAEIQELGRWETEKSAKQYIDVLFNVLPEVLALESRVWPNTEAALAPWLAAMW